MSINDPVSGRPALLLIQTDITNRVRHFEGSKKFAQSLLPSQLVCKLLPWSVHSQLILVIQSNGAFF